MLETPTPLDGLDEWIDRRLRAVRWKEWKPERTRYRMLRTFGLPHFTAKRGHSKRGLWRMSHAGAIQQALPRSYWAGLGVCSLVERYARVRVV